jgi:hypothetical protein
MDDRSDAASVVAGAGAINGLVGPAGTRAYEATYPASGVVDSVNERP